MRKLLSFLIFTSLLFSFNIFSFAAGVPITGITTSEGQQFYNSPYTNFIGNNRPGFSGQRHGGQFITGDGDTDPSLPPSETNHYYINVDNEYKQIQSITQINDNSLNITTIDNSVYYTYDTTNFISYTTINQDNSRYTDYFYFDNRTFNQTSDNTIYLSAGNVFSYIDDRFGEQVFLDSYIGENDVYCFTDEEIGYPDGTEALIIKPASGNAPLSLNTDLYDYYLEFLLASGDNLDSSQLMTVNSIEYLFDFSRITLTGNWHNADNVYIAGVLDDNNESQTYSKGLVFTGKVDFSVNSPSVFGGIRLNGNFHLKGVTVASIKLIPVLKLNIDIPDVDLSETNSLISSGNGFLSSIFLVLQSIKVSFDTLLNKIDLLFFKSSSSLYDRYDFNFDFMYANLLTSTSPFYFTHSGVFDYLDTFNQTFSNYFSLVLNNDNYFQYDYLPDSFDYFYTFSLLSTDLNFLENVDFGTVEIRSSYPSSSGLEVYDSFTSSSYSVSRVFRYYYNGSPFYGITLIVPLPKTYNVSSLRSVRFSLNHSLALNGSLLFKSSLYQIVSSGNINLVVQNDLNNIVNNGDTLNNFVINGDTNTTTVINHADNVKNEYNNSVTNITNNFNQLDSYENQYKSEVVDYQNDIDLILDDFTISEDLLDTGAFLSGNLTDIYNNMGKFKSTVLLPLILGIAGLFIGV